MRAFSALLLIVFSLLQYRLWLGKNSVSDYLALQDDVTRQQLVNTKLRQRNKLLYADTDDLKLGTEAIEERARNELGMIKENETFFRVIPSKANSMEENATKNNTNKRLY